MRDSRTEQSCPDSARHPAVELTTPGDHKALLRIAKQVADCFANSGYAFVEEDRIEGLAAMLRSFLIVADIPVNSAGDRADRS